MRPIIPYTDSLSDENLIQLIGESENHESDTLFTKEENSEFLKNGRICMLLNDIEFTIESYGLLNFLIEYNDQISDLKELGELLRQFGHLETSQAIQKTLHFYDINAEVFKYLEKSPYDYDLKYSHLEQQLNSMSEDGFFSIPLQKSIKLLAAHIRANKSKFFISKNES